MAGRRQRGQAPGVGRRPLQNKDLLPRSPESCEHDTYAKRQKSPDAFVCDACRVVQFGGKWRWGAPPTGTVRGGLCPACERVRDDYPAGSLHVPAALFHDGEELLGVVGHVASRETAEHPLERVIRVELAEDGMTVTTTGIHLARSLAGKLSRSLGRKAQLHYPAEQHRLVVSWKD